MSMIRPNPDLLAVIVVSPIKSNNREFIEGSRRTVSIRSSWCIALYPLDHTRTLFEMHNSQQRGAL